MGKPILKKKSSAKPLLIPSKEGQSAGVVRIPITHEQAVFLISNKDKLSHFVEIAEQSYLCYTNRTG